MLRDIRDVMGGGESAEGKLELVVEKIAATLNSDVCSIYLLRAGDVLELFANVGFNRSSIHSARLSVGQGLVGEVAATRTPLNLSDAQNHPNFIYLPITGEELYNSFLGVPLLRNGEITGVLVVQDKRARQFDDMIVEVMQTIAMVVAELVSASGIVGQEELAKGRAATLFPQHFVGAKLAPGIAKSSAHVHEPTIEITKFVADDLEKEKERFADALKELRGGLDKLVESSTKSMSGEMVEIMEAYRMFAYDKGWSEKVLEAIETGLTAEAAVKMAQDQIRVKMEKTTNEYLRERMHDVENLGTRLLQILSGNIKVHSPVLTSGEGFILVARNLGPAELFDYDRTKIKGIVVEEGSATSHVVIIARALEIPTVGRIRGATNHIRNGDRVIVNGDGGEVYLHPTNEIERVFDSHIHGRESRRAYFAEVRDLPAMTLDGTKVSINMNAGLFIDLGQLNEVGADGIGLYRTELPFMMAKSFPSSETQAEMYTEVLKQAKGKKVIFRTFDIGGDKKVDYIETPEEENPAMGWRAARIAIDRPSIIKTQMRALITAGGDKEIHVMFPFIAEVTEFDTLKKIFLSELEAVKAAGLAVPKKVNYGAMIEVPSILWDLDSLMKRVDFVSIGSNDLMQFIFACDRNSQAVADRYSILSPIMFNVLRSIVTSAAKYNVEVGFCGEMASRPVQAMCLLALGFRSLSMPASYIGAIKAMIRSLDLAKLTEFFDSLASREDAGNLAAVISAYAHDNGILV